MAKAIVRRVGAWAVLVLTPAGIAGCGALDVSDPTAIEDGELADDAGANLLRADALRRLYMAVGQGALLSGLLADEFLAETPPTFQQLGSTNVQEVLDRRESVEFEERDGATSLYTQWHEARRAATLAIPKLRAYALAAAVRVGEMFAARGVVILHLAEHFCPGFPLHGIENYTPAFGNPLSTDEAFERALADFDSAVAYAADSARVLNWARIGRARALLGLGRFAEAGTSAAPVPTVFVRNAEYNSSAFLQTNPLGVLVSPLSNVPERSVANEEGGTGLDFVAAGDPRVQTTFKRVAADGTTGLYAAAKYPNENAPIVMASGIEARLIEAEAALNGTGDWLVVLNNLRATQINPPLPALADPGTRDAQVDLLFRERAFWLFGTGHRLGDLRRLISRYGRNPETVFPTGAYRLGGVYETATSIPFPAALETPFNPAVTGCTSR